MDSRGGWEQTKENILPLRAGRRMAHLAEALPTRTATGLSDQLQYEQHHLKEVERLEALAEQNLGEDPLQAWVDAIKYLEQHFPNMSSNIQFKYSKLQMTALRSVWNEIRYKNDERMVEIALGVVKTTPAAQQIQVLNQLMASGIGERVSAMYIKLAEQYDAEGDTRKASEMLKKGLENNAQPRQNLEEMLTHIHETWAKNYAQSLKNGGPEKDARSFASSVPIVGEKNEAVSIRQNLPPAAPTSTAQPSTRVRQNIGPQRLAVYNEEENTAPVQGNNHQQKPGPWRDDLTSAEADRENRQDACRWNSRHTHLEEPVIPEPPEKMNLYVDSDTVSTSSSDQQSSQQANEFKKHVLQERKEEVADTSEAELISSQLVEKLNQNEKKEPEVEKVEKPEEEETEAASVPKAKPKPFTWTRNYDPEEAKKKDFWENVTYKPFPPGFQGGRMMLKVDKWFEKREKELKAQEEEAKEQEKLQNQVDRLTSHCQKLTEEMEKMKENTAQLVEAKVNQIKSFYDQVLEEKDAKIARLEARNEDLIGQLTKLTTDKNLQDTKFQRLQLENMQMQEQMIELQKNLREERQYREAVQEELQECKRKYDLLSEQLSVAKRVRNTEIETTEASSYRQNNWSHLSKKQSFVDVDVRSRTTEVEVSSSPPSSTQVVSDNSRFNSGETTVEHQQRSVAYSSFCPQLDDKSMMMMSIDEPPSPIPPRKVLGMVERPSQKDMMNMTPAAAPVDDFDIPPPSRILGAGLRPKKFTLYESIHESTFGGRPPPAPKPTVAAVSSKRVDDVVKNLQTLSENQAPPPEPRPVPTMNVIASAESFQNDEPAFQFRRPNDNDENEAPVRTLQKPRRSMLLGRPIRQDVYSDDDEDDDDVILRRHQQTGLDLNISNLTTVLMLGPKPLVNSTPEREQTLRDIRNGAFVPPRSLAFQQDQDEVPAAAVADSQQYSTAAASARASRFSILNEPPLNLSTIQETSREYRSRSTTGSSSGTTMSTTRFLGNATSTQLNINSRSSSIPRSASRVSQNTNNGYYSDTNNY